jgi:beta-glucoside PTS system EIICBA component
MNKYENLAQEIVKTLGGKDNITYFSHCVTRLRATLKDKSLVDDEKIKKIKGVLDCRWTGDQVQIIIGQHVAEVYDEICDTFGIEKQAMVNENLDEDAKKKEKNKITPWSFIQLMSWALEPALFAFIGAGLIKVVLIFLDMGGILTSDTSTYQVFYNAADSIIYYLPIFIGYGVAKKMGNEPALGIAVGAFLVAPNFLANVNGGVTMTLFGINIYSKAYSSTFLPALICTFFTCLLYSWLEEKVPKLIRNLVAPLVTFIVMIPLSYLILAPIASIAGDYLSIAVMWLYNLLGFAGVAMFCGILPFLITTGMHFCFYPYWGSAVSSGSGELFYLISNCIFNINVGVACAVISFKTKIVENKSTCISAGVSSAIAGVSEPALFGIVLKSKGALTALIIGDVVGGAVAGLLHVAAYMWPASWGVFMIPSFINPADGSGLVQSLIAVLAGVVVTAIMTFILYKDEQVSE